MLDKLKELGASAISSAIDKFSEVRITDTYDAGLPDVKGPKPMTLVFMKDKVEITYRNFGVFPQKIIIHPADILELEIGVQNADTVSNTIKGAIAGNVLAGGFGSLALANSASKKRKEDSLHLIINYKGQARPLHFQNIKNAQKMYQAFSRLYTPKQTTPNKTITEVVNKDDIAKQLTDLNNLVQQGILTQEEFEVQKKKILST